MRSKEPPGQNECPGGETEALKKSLAGDYDDLIAMRRRKAAALRLPPLASGYRDPQFGFRRDGAAS